MSNASGETLTGFDLWTPNDYSNFVTISAAAIGSTLLVIFKSRCKNISLCFGLVNCIREVQDETDEEEDKDKDKDKDKAGGSFGDKDKDKDKPNILLRQESILPADNP